MIVQRNYPKNLTRSFDDLESKITIENKDVCISAKLSLIGFLQLNLNKIPISCAVNNESSMAAALRVGMVYEEVLREEEWLYNHFMDHAVYSMLQREFYMKPVEMRLNDF